MHDPGGFFTFGGSASVENQSFLHPKKSLSFEDLLVFAGGLPVAGGGGPVCSRTSGVFAVAEEEKVGVFVRHVEGGGKIPRVGGVEIGVGDGGSGEGGVESLGREVVEDELFIGGVESESGRQFNGVRRRRDFHFLE